MVLGITPVAIIDRQLPFEYTITSRSTDVVVPVLRAEKKIYVIEQPIPLALAADSPAEVLMKGYVEQLKRLGYVLPQDFSVGLLLNGLTSDFDGFVRNYNMHNMGKTIGELHALHIEYEKGKGKAKGKGKDKQVYIPKPKNPNASAKEHLAKDDTCHHCKDVGHWKWNCLVYLAELLKRKKQVGSTSSSAASQ
ncbi:retrotransposon protein, putative, ty1-copia subclass [Tanacetum coccineum]